MNWVFGVTNFVLPGVGTLLAVCFGNKATTLQFMIGCFQLVSAPLLIGWIFSILWGVILIRKPYQDNPSLLLDKVEENMNDTIIKAIQVGESGERYQREKQFSREYATKNCLSV